MNHNSDPNIQTPNSLNPDYRLPLPHIHTGGKGGDNGQHGGFNGHGGHGHAHGQHGSANGHDMHYPLADNNGQYPPPPWNPFPPLGSMGQSYPIHQFSPSVPPPHQLPPQDYSGGSRSTPHLYPGSTRVSSQYFNSPDSRYTSNSSPFSPSIPLEHSTPFGGHGLFPPHPTPYSSRTNAPARPPSGREERLASARAGPSQSAQARPRSTSEGSSRQSWEGQTGVQEVYDDKTPWGMPQEVYKALPAKEKKQVRNKVGARKFRNKRKLEKKALTAENQAYSVEIAALYSHIEEMRKTINSLKMVTGDNDLLEPLPSRAFAPPITDPSPGQASETGALGLDVDGHAQH